MPSDTLTDEHISWAEEFVGMKIRPEGASTGAPAGSDAPSGGGILDTLSDAASSVASTVSDAASSVADGVSSAAGTVADGVSSAASTVADTAGQVVNAVEDAASTVADGLSDAASSVADGVSSAASAVADTVSGAFDTVKKAVEDLFSDGDKPQPEKPIALGEIGTPQLDRANKLLEAMPPEDKAKIQKVMDGATPEAKKYLTKALASKHSAAEIEEFSKKIAGKDQKWMDEHLHLVGQSDGKGIKQQWHDSCGPTTVQAMTGELDPIYALKTREDNTDVTDVNEDDGEAMNKAMADEQKKNLEDHGGVAKPRAPGKSAGGKGMPLDDLLSEQTDKVGVKFDREDLSSDDGMTKGLDDAQKSLKSGLPVPVRVTDGAGGHFILMTGVEDGPPRKYSFHDPWDGKTVVYTDEQIKKNQLNIAGHSKMSHIYNPSAA